mmetsp:Transcript_1734/g.3030  ORF Transcript_1734/g.3030 Transcript_1734/m.3030 type:complete len:200 (-) Transcript_1734:959-1558(-)
MFHNTSSVKRLPSMFVVAAISTLCACSVVKPYSSKRSRCKRVRMPSGKVKWCWMMCTTASMITGESCGLSIYMILALVGLTPGFRPVLPKLIGSGAPPNWLLVSGTFTMTLLSWSSDSVAVTSGLCNSIAAQRSTASNCANFTMSSPKPFCRLSGVGFVLANAQARRFCAPLSGGISGSWTFRASMSSNNSCKLQGVSR